MFICSPATIPKVTNIHVKLVACELETIPTVANKPPISMHRLTEHPSLIKLATGPGKIHLDVPFGNYAKFLTVIFACPALILFLII